MHFLTRKPNALFLRLDYCAIFLFIAGSYTPFALGPLQSGWGWTLFGLVWSLAVAGVILKSTGQLAHPWVSTGLYLGMGALVLVAAVPLIERVPTQGLIWLLTGGLAYTAGVVFFALDSRIRYAHAIWHGFVVAGTGCLFLRYWAMRPDWVKLTARPSVTIASGRSFDTRARSGGTGSVGCDGSLTPSGTNPRPSARWLAGILAIRAQVRRPNLIAKHKP